MIEIEKQAFPLITSIRLTKCHATVSISKAAARTGDVRVVIGEHRR